MKPIGVCSVLVFAVLFVLLSGAAMSANVRELGAVGDGVADDTAAIQTVIDALPVGGGRVYLPAGIYLVKKLALKTGVTLQGDGPSTVLLAAQTSPYLVTFASGTAERVRIADLTLDGNAPSQKDSAFGLYLPPGCAVSDLTVERVHFRNHPAHAIAIGKADHHGLRFNKLDIVKPGGNGFWIDGGADISITDCRISGAGGSKDAHGIETTYKSNVGNLLIAHCTVSGSGGHNIFLGDTSNTRIEDNMLDFAGRVNDTMSGIQANRAYSPTMVGLVISGNVIDNSQGYGICCSGVDEFIIQGNRLHRGGDPAIEITGGCHDWIIADNTITDVPSVALSIIAEPVDQPYNAVIKGNVIRRNGMMGIAVSAGQELVISGNTILNNGYMFSKAGDKADPADYSGIALINARHNVITGNRVGNNANSQTQALGIVESHGSDYNLVQGNDLIGNLKKALVLKGSHSRASGNLGVSGR